MCVSYQPRCVCVSPISLGVYVCVYLLLFMAGLVLVLLVFLLAFFFRALHGL